MGGVPCKHGGGDASAAEQGDSGSRIGFYLIVDENGAQILVVLCHEYLCAVVVSVGDGNAMVGHELGIAAQDGLTVDGSGDACARDFTHRGGVQGAAARFSGCGKDTAGDGMGGAALTGGSQCQQVGFGNGVVNRETLLYTEDTAGQGACLIQRNCLDAAEGFQCGAALEQNALLGAAADAAEECQRYAEHQCAGAADDQEGQSGVNPVAPLTCDQRGNHGSEQSQGTDDGGVHTAEAGDKAVDFGFGCGGIFHGVQDAGDHGVFQILFHAHFQQAFLVDPAGGHSAACGYVDGNRLPCDGGGVHEALALCDGAVQRDTVTGANEENIANVGIFRRDDLHGIALNPVYHLGAQVHSFHNLAAAAAGGNLLKELAYAVKQHNAQCFLVAADAEGTDGGNGHEEVFVEDLTAADVAQCFLQHRAAAEHIAEEHH